MIKTIAFLLSAFLCMLLSTGCSKQERRDDTGAHARGRALFVSQRCANCHGDAGEGAAHAPPLAGLRQHYSIDRLMTYLRDPSSSIKQDPRLMEQQSRYPSLMPSFKYLDEADLREIASYVLSLEP